MCNLELPEERRNVAQPRRSLVSPTACLSDTEAGVNVGAGARWQPGANWGVRPELNVDRRQQQRPVQRRPLLSVRPLRQAIVCAVTHDPARTRPISIARQSGRL